MARYKKKPVEVEAIQFTGDNWTELKLFCGTHRNSGNQRDIDTFNQIGTYTSSHDPTVIAEVWDRLHSTWVGVKDGHWIIKGLQGEFYPCDPYAFEEIYDLVQENSDHPVIGPECFTNADSTVICYKGEMYYRACDAHVAKLIDGGDAYCVKRVGHPGKVHEAYDGMTFEEK